MRFIFAYDNDMKQLVYHWKMLKNQVDLCQIMLQNDDINYM